MLANADESMPFLRHSDGTKLFLRLGDTSCIHSCQSDVEKSSSWSFYLPGKLNLETFCTFSVLFDGSLIMSKESNLAPEIFCNGNRVPAGINVSIQSGDSIVVGSSEYAFTADLNDYDDEEERVPRKEPNTLDEIFNEVNVLVSRHAH